MPVMEAGSEHYMAVKGAGGIMRLRVVGLPFVLFLSKSRFQIGISTAVHSAGDSLEFTSVAGSDRCSEF